jgi:FKBP-type peptidyl-prolyl cis-trans isomerase SlyD
MSEAVADGKVVLIHYTLRNDAGDVLDTSEGMQPLPYLQGVGNIVPGLERQMVGHAAGDSFECEVSPEEGYGERMGDGPQHLPRTDFPDDVPIQAGIQFWAETPEGEKFPIWVTGVEDDKVIVDQNHPLAGEVLHFAIDVVEVRDATDEETEHGHPHGADGTEEH